MFVGKCTHMSIYWFKVLWIHFKLQIRIKWERKFQNKERDERIRRLKAATLAEAFETSSNAKIPADKKRSLKLRGFELSSYNQQERESPDLQASAQKYTNMKTPRVNSVNWKIIDEIIVDNVQKGKKHSCASSSDEVLKDTSSSTVERSVVIETSKVKRKKVSICTCERKIEKITTPKTLSQVKSRIRLLLIQV